MKPKWIENLVKMEPNTDEKRVKNQVEIFELFGNSYQVSKRVFNDFAFFMNFVRHVAEIPEDFHGIS